MLTNIRTDNHSGATGVYIEKLAIKPHTHAVYTFCLFLQACAMQITVSMYAYNQIYLYLYICLFDIIMPALQTSMKHQTF